LKLGRSLLPFFGRYVPRNQLQIQDKNRVKDRDQEQGDEGSHPKPATASSSVSTRTAFCAKVEKPVPKSRRRSSGRIMEKVLSTFKEERKWNSVDYNPSWLLSRLAPTLLRK
jgi:hypothetical protein